MLGFEAARMHHKFPHGGKAITIPLVLLSQSMPPEDWARRRKSGTCIVSNLPQLQIDPQAYLCSHVTPNRRVFDISFIAMPCPMMRAS